MVAVLHAIPHVESTITLHSSPVALFGGSRATSSDGGPVLAANARRPSRSPAARALLSRVEPVLPIHNLQRVLPPLVGHAVGHGWQSSATALSTGAVALQPDLLVRSSTV